MTLPNGHAPGSCGPDMSGAMSSAARFVNRLILAAIFVWLAVQYFN
jgi:hypothetical protein